MRTYFICSSATCTTTLIISQPGDEIFSRVSFRKRSKILVAIREISGRKLSCSRLQFTLNTGVKLWKFAYWFRRLMVSFRNRGKNLVCVGKVFESVNGYRLRLLDWFAFIIIADILCRFRCLCSPVDERIRESYFTNKGNQKKINVRK